MLSMKKKKVEEKVKKQFAEAMVKSQKKLGLKVVKVKIK